MSKQASILLDRPYIRRLLEGTSIPKADKRSQLFGTTALSAVKKNYRTFSLKPPSSKNLELLFLFKRLCSKAGEPSEMGEQ
jgi:hypothetical protein